MDDTKAEPDDTPTEEPDEGRLDELGDRIQSVRSQAAEAVACVDEPKGENQEKFAESGSEEAAAEDDQAIAPPG
ncbi:MAG: hypothetical protein DLM65_09030 [Candidatus Aeolococcus gillhamiae]|uniref:Uncharacterized protein n=1 Tax=Candidatus Aeolococcus gillhamiae TaxID=3127015 RepID=A0A2W5Z4B5_9BACT|nr:MAG: hypothetical protein DLM65_09030 [Candidatus Dormibacter sp. RRmetagenome_bin12]